MSNPSNKKSGLPPGAREWILAAEAGDLKTMKAMVERGWDVNERDVSIQSVSALYFAARSNNAEMTRFLLDNGAYIGGDVLEIAKGYGHSKIIKMLEETAVQRATAQATPLLAAKKHDDELSAAVEGGDCQRARAVFDKVFWDGKKIVPSWEHLKIALLREDKPMMRLLVTWGAKAPESAEHLAGIPADKYARYARILRTYGLDATVVETAAATVPQAAEEAPVTGAISMEDVKKEPQSFENMWDWPQVLKEGVSRAMPMEWKQVLLTMHNFGGSGAVIAGGALRDTFNGKPVKDVDIFLKTRGSEKKNRALLEAVFSASGVEVFKQDMNDDNYCPTFEAFPKPAAVTEGSWLNRKKIMESWKVIAGPNKTEYNIIFVDGSLAEVPKKDFGARLIAGFDMGFCQIAYDGWDIITTPYFRRDVASQRITMVAANASSQDHLERLRRKYPDWQLCREDGHLFSDVYDVPGKGIYVGTREITDAKGRTTDINGRSFGTFHIYAAPEDLKDGASSRRITGSFNHAAMRVAAGAHWYGHTGVHFTSDSELYKAIRKGKYQGEWFIPPMNILKENLYANKDKGALRGTFSDACYWASTELPSQNNFVSFMYFSNGQMNHGYREECYDIACRAVRMEPVNAVKKKTGTGSTGPK